MATHEESVKAILQMASPRRSGRPQDSLNYSKWDNLVDSDDEEADSPKPSRRLASPIAPPPPALTDHLRDMKSSNPAKLAQLKQELEVMKQDALRQKQQLNGGGGGGGSAVEVLMKQSDVLQQQLNDIEKKKGAMDANMERLEKLAAAGDGASVLSFFESQGMSRDDVQRMMSGSDDDTKEVLSKTASKAAEVDDEPEAAERAMRLADDMQAVLTTGEMPEQRPERGDGPIVGPRAEEEEEQEEEEQEEEEEEEGGTEEDASNSPGDDDGASFLLQDPITAAATAATSPKQRSSARSGRGLLKQPSKRAPPTASPAAASAPPTSPPSSGPPAKHGQVAGGRAISGAAPPPPGPPQTMPPPLTAAAPKEPTGDSGIVPSHTEKVVEATAAVGRHIAVVVGLPELRGGVQDVELDVAPRTFKLRGPIACDDDHHAAGFTGGKEYLLDFDFAEEVDPARCKAKWSKKTKALTVTVPVVV